MWGALFSHEGKNKDPAFRGSVIKAFKKHCDDLDVLPYHVPVGGFMVSPVFDIDVGTIYEIGMRLEEVMKRTMKEVQWERPEEPVKDFDMAELAARIMQDDKCLPHLHTTRSCTSCSSFVCRDLRTHFVNV
jgi:hypothetical protein